MSFSTEQQEQVIYVPMICVPQELFIAKQHFQLEVCHQKSLREKGP